MKSCDTCRFWQPASSVKFREGECRASLPVIEFYEAEDGETTQRGYWPTTGADDWCKFHEPEPQETA